MRPTLGSKANPEPYDWLCTSRAAVAKDHLMTPTHGGEGQTPGRAGVHHRTLGDGSCTCTLRINTTGSPGRPSKDQKGLYERALTAPQRPSPPCGHPRRRPCGRTAPAQATSSCHFPRPYLLTPLLAAATAARERAGLRAGSRRGQSAPPPWPAYRAASVWLSPSRWSAAAAAGPGVSCYEGLPLADAAQSSRLAHAALPGVDGAA